MEFLIFGNFIFSKEAIIIELSVPYIPINLASFKGTFLYIKCIFNLGNHIINKSIKKQVNSEQTIRKKILISEYDKDSILIILECSSHISSYLSTNCSYSVEIFFL